MMTLFGHEDSGHAYKVRLMMCTAAIPHQYRRIDIWADRSERPEDFQRLSPFQEVPLLVDADEVYMQSGAILLHLAKTFGCYGGEDSDTLARCCEWIVWEANKIGMCLPQIRAKVKFNEPAVNDGAMIWLLDRYSHDVGVLDSVLSDGRSWIVSAPTPTIADFALSGYLFLAHEAGVEVPASIAEWLERLRQLPHWESPVDLLSSDG